QSISIAIKYWSCVNRHGRSVRAMQSRPALLLIGALAFTAGIVGEVVHAIFLPVRRKMRLGARAQALTRAVIGHSKGYVARLLGPPPAAVATGVGEASYWVADTWYYPYDVLRRTAVAVLFDRDRVVRVEIIPPG